MQKGGNEPENVREETFQNATGESSRRYLQLARVENAKHLLAFSDRTFDEITYLVGYEDSSTSSRMFKKTTGLSPKSCKKKYSFRPV